MSANSGGGLSPSYEGFGPSSGFCHLTSSIMPVEDQSVDPHMLQLASRTHGQEGQSSFSDAVECDDEGLVTYCALVSCHPPLPDSSFPTFPDVDPIGVHENSPIFAEVPEFMEMGIDEFFDHPETGELENLDYFFSDASRVPDEQSFDHPETSEPVIIHDDLSGPPWTSADAMEIDVDPRDQAGDCGGPVTAPSPSSPLSPPPDSPVVPYHPEGEDGMYLVERIMQAWGPRRRRQYLIRWQGWGPEFDSWEQASNVSAELREEFEGPRRSRRRRHPRRRR